jgi:hypothetical protein
MGWRPFHSRLLPSFVSITDSAVQATAVKQCHEVSYLAAFHKEVAMRPTIVILLGLVLVIIGFGAPVAADAFVGVVKTVAGDAVIEREGETIPINTGMEIKEADVVKTGRKGTVGLVFSDDTRISMGPNAEIVVDAYLFEPLEKKLSFVLRLIRGTVSFLSGQMTKLSSESVQLVMPAATIGVRGTHVLIKVD